MYTLQRVLELLDMGEDIYSEICKSDRYITEGWLSDLDLEPNTEIEMYRLDYDDEGDEYLVLHLA